MGLCERAAREHREAARRRRKVIVRSCIAVLACRSHGVAAQIATSGELAASAWTCGGNILHREHYAGRHDKD
jgi:hypothetical protein